MILIALGMSSVASTLQIKRRKYLLHQVYCNHLDQLHEEFNARFTDLISLTIPEWVMDPFMEVSYSGIVDVDLIILQNDFELHAKFKLSSKDFWLQNGISEHYPTLWNIVKIFFIVFPTSYLVE